MKQKEINIDSETENMNRDKLARHIKYYTMEKPCWRSIPKVESSFQQILYFHGSRLKDFKVKDYLD